MRKLPRAALHRLHTLASMAFLNEVVAKIPQHDATDG